MYCAWGMAATCSGGGPAIHKTTTMCCASSAATETCHVMCGAIPYSHYPYPYLYPYPKTPMQDDARQVGNRHLFAFSFFNKILVGAFPPEPSKKSGQPSIEGYVDATPTHINHTFALHIYSIFIKR